MIRTRKNGRYIGILRLFWFRLFDTDLVNQNRQQIIVKTVRILRIIFINRICVKYRPKNAEEVESYSGRLLL